MFVSIIVQNYGNLIEARVYIRALEQFLKKKIITTWSSYGGAKKGLRSNSVS